MVNRLDLSVSTSFIGEESFVPSRGFSISWTGFSFIDFAFYYNLFEYEKHSAASIGLGFD